jgi:hypothetical protein
MSGVFDMCGSSVVCSCVVCSCVVCVCVSVCVCVCVHVFFVLASFFEGEGKGNLYGGG